MYGRLTILEESERSGYQRKVLVRCSCEAATEKAVRLSSLRNGQTTSCGCLQKAATRAANTSHGLRQHSTYRAWRAMLTRCTNPNHESYLNYGGRGITVCDRWKKFENFYADMQPTYEEGLTLDRKDSSQGYNPENCKWATWTEQARNRRSNINVTFSGKTQCLADWCKELNLNYKTIQTRISRGKTPEQALQFQKNSP